MLPQRSVSPVPDPESTTVEFYGRPRRSCIAMKCEKLREAARLLAKEGFETQSIFRDFLKKLVESEGKPSWTAPYCSGYWFTARNSGKYVMTCLTDFIQLKKHILLGPFRVSIVTGDACLNAFAPSVEAPESISSPPPTQNFRFPRKPLPRKFHGVPRAPRPIF